MATTHEKLEFLALELQHRVRGQPESLNRLWEAVARRELEATPQHGPPGCFFFAGPTGVGKTETAKILGEVLFGANRCLRIDCSEYKTLGSLESLLGDRAGDRGRLGRAHAKAPEGLWLWDEIEKGHPELSQLFLQMADDGRVTLTCGETLDLGRIYLILTSNLGSAEIIGREHLPFTSLERHVVRAIERFLRPELLARFGSPFVFRPLGREIQSEIAGQRLADLLLWQQSKGRSITAEPEVLPFLVHRGFSRRLGARPLIAFIEENVGNAIKENLLSCGNGNGCLVVAEDRLRLST